MQELKNQGLGLAAVSYDTPAILKHFSERKQIAFPLLSDADSAVIRAFGILNENMKPGSPVYGIPHPVTFVVTPDGKVVRKYFEVDFRERQTLSGALVKDYGITPAAARSTPSAKHVQIAASASSGAVRGGQRIVLAMDIEIPKDHHLYAPGVEGYYAVEWKLTESPAWRAQAAAYPKSRILYMKAIEEKVPVFEGRLRLTRDVTLGPDKAVRALVNEAKQLVMEGSLRYQACSDRLCYPPETVPVKWTLQLEAHDSERVPPDLRKLK